MPHAIVAGGCCIGTARAAAPRAPRAHWTFRVPARLELCFKPPLGGASDVVGSADVQGSPGSAEATAPQRSHPKTGGSWRDLPGGHVVGGIGHDAELLHEATSEQDATAVTPSRTSPPQAHCGSARRRGRNLAERFFPEAERPRHAVGRRCGRFRPCCQPSAHPSGRAECRRTIARQPCAHARR